MAAGAGARAARGRGPSRGRIAMDCRRGRWSLSRGARRKPAGRTAGRFLASRSGSARFAPSAMGSHARAIRYFGSGRALGSGLSSGRSRAGSPGRALAALRHEVESVAPEAVACFLPAWHGVGAKATGVDRLLEVVFQLQGAALPASVIERDVIAARVGGYSPRLLDELISMGEVVWVGRGSLGTSDGKVALYLRGDAPRLVPEPTEAADDEVHRRLREHLKLRGASFFRDLYNAGGGGDEDAILDALWDLVWSGEVTNDTFAPLRLLGPLTRRPTGRPKLPRLTQPRAAGRWSLVADLVGSGAAPTERLHSEAGVLLQRYGVLTREGVVAESWPGGFAALYPVLRAMEESGRIRRGYFIEGLGGSQFALPGAVDRSEE